MLRSFKSHFHDWYYILTYYPCFLFYYLRGWRIYCRARSRVMCVIAVLYIYATRLLLPNWGVQNCGCKDETCDMGGGEEVAVCLLKFLSWVFPCLTPVCYSAESFAQERRGIFLRHMKISEMSRSMLLPSLHILDSNSWIIPNRVIRFQGYSLSKREAKIVLRLCTRGIHWETESRSRHTRK